MLAHAAGDHACILAGPGTGKSATLVAWIGDLLERDDPPKLRLLTFTRAATAELAAKVLDHEALAVERPSTVHSFAISVLLSNPGSGDFPEPLRLADDWEQDQVVNRSLARRAGIHKNRIQRLVREMAAAWESLVPEEDPEVDAKERDRFLGAWNENRRILGYTLLAELPYALLEALRHHPDLENVDFDLVIVDEYQDLNACDLAIFKELSTRGCTIVGAGDDDQSIYSFRRADPEGIRRFLADYPTGTQFPLSVSRRCGRRILDWANHVIEGDPDRPEKAPLTCLEEASDGEVALLSFAGHVAEATGIAKLIKSLIDEEGLQPQEILILLRGDHHGQFSKPIKEKLDELDIPYSNPDAVKELLAVSSNRFIIEMMRLAADPDDSIAWASLLTLTSGISETFIVNVYDDARQAGETFGKALLRLRDEGFPALPAPSATKATDLVDAARSWLAEHELPEELDEGGWGRWIIERSRP